MQAESVVRMGLKAAPPCEWYAK